MGIDLTHLDKTPISAARNFSTVIVPWIWLDDLLFKRMTMGLDHGSFISVCANPAIHGWKRRQWYAHGFRLSTNSRLAVRQGGKNLLRYQSDLEAYLSFWECHSAGLSATYPQWSWGRQIAGFSCRLTTNPTELSLPITDITMASLRSQKGHHQNLTKTET